MYHLNPPCPMCSLICRFQNDMIQNKTSIFKCEITSLYNLLVMKAFPEGDRKHPQQNIVKFYKMSDKGLKTQKDPRQQLLLLIGVNLVR